jgi:hypothetical protein
MAHEFLIDFNDLLELSRHELFMSYDKGKYSVVSSDKCKNINKVISLLHKCIKKKIPYFKVKLNHESMKILSIGRSNYEQIGAGNNNMEKLKLIYNRENIQNIELIKDALRVVMTGIKFTGGIMATIGTAGAGGDTIIESIITTINSGIFCADLLHTILLLSENSIYLKKLMDITFMEGPQKVKDDTLSIVKQIIIDGNEDMIDIICNILGSLLKSISMVVGDWISTFIPNDSGVVGTTVAIIVNISANQAYDVLDSLFNKIPNVFQELLKDPQQLSVFLINILDMFEKALRNKDPPSDQMTFTDTFGRLKKVGRQLLPGLALAEKYGLDDEILNILLEIIENHFKPNIENSVKVVRHVMPLIFIILIFNNICSDETILRQIKMEIKKSPVKYHDVEYKQIHSDHGRANVYDNTEQAHIYTNNSHTNVYPNIQQVNAHPNTRRAHVYPNIQQTHVHPNTRRAQVYPNIQQTHVYPNFPQTHVHPNTQHAHVYRDSRRVPVYPNMRQSNIYPISK